MLWDKTWIIVMSSTFELCIEQQSSSSHEMWAVELCIHIMLPEPFLICITSTYCQSTNGGKSGIHSCCTFFIEPWFGIISCLVVLEIEKGFKRLTLTDKVTVHNWMKRKLKTFFLNGMIKCVALNGVWLFWKINMQF